MFRKYSFFATEIWQRQCDIDTSAMFDRCKQHQTQHANIQLSNRGGYQGQNFQDREFSELVLSSIPALPDRPLPKIQMQAWVNINGYQHWNALHNHLDEHCLISGIFYVRCPENSGDLYVYDPRYLSNAGVHYKYYCSELSNGSGCMQLTPTPNSLIFFPPSIMHMVGPNLSHEERCSIAFNILVEPGQKIL